MLSLGMNVVVDAFTLYLCVLLLIAFLDCCYGRDCRHTAYCSG